MASGTIPKYMDGTDSGWVDIAVSSIMSANTGTLQYRKQGNLVEIVASSLLFKNEVTSAGAQVLNASALPSGIRPSQNITAFGATGVNYPAYVGVFANGNIAIYKPSFLSSIAITWPISLHVIYSL
jgi:hypothetical protein